MTTTYNSIPGFNYVNARRSGGAAPAYKPLPSFSAAQPQAERLHRIAEATPHAAMLIGKMHLRNTKARR